MWCNCIEAYWWFGELEQFRCYQSGSKLAEWNDSSLKMTLGVVVEVRALASSVLIMSDMGSGAQLQGWTKVSGVAVVIKANQLLAEASYSLSRHESGQETNKRISPNVELFLRGIALGWTIMCEYRKVKNVIWATLRSHPPFFSIRIQTQTVWSHYLHHQWAQLSYPKRIKFIAGELSYESELTACKVTQFCCKTKHFFTLYITVSTYQPILDVGAYRILFPVRIDSSY